VLDGALHVVGEETAMAVDSLGSDALDDRSQDALRTAEHQESGAAGECRRLHRVASDLGRDIDCRARRG